MAIIRSGPGSRFPGVRFLAGGLWQTLGLRLAIVPAVFSAFIIADIAAFWGLYSDQTQLRREEQVLFDRLAVLRTIEVSLSALRADLSLAMIWHVSDTSGVKSAQALEKARGALAKTVSQIRDVEIYPSSQSIDGRTVQERIAHIGELFEVSYENFVRVPFIAAGNLNSLELQLNYLRYDLETTRKVLNANVAAQAAALNQSYRFAFFWNLIGLLAVLSIGWLASRFVHKSVLNPLQALERCIDRIIHGDLRVKIPDVSDRNALGSMVRAVRNLRQSKVAEKEAMQRAIDAEKLASLGNLVAGVAHEINTPIGIALTAASHLNEQTQSVRSSLDQDTLRKSQLVGFLEDADENAGLVVSNIQRASDLIRSFKQVAVDQSAQRIRRFGLHDIVQQAADSFVKQIRTANVTVRNKILPDLDLNCDPGAYSQIFTNLTANALLHAFEGRAEGTITIGARTAGQTLLVFFTDDGNGMRQETAAQIFEPFYTTKRHVGGTGLGMHIVYNLVTQSLGGRISVASELDAGTAITIEIPLKPDRGS